MVNARKEYFRISLDEIRTAVESHHGLVTFVLTPEAEAEMMRGQCIPEKLYPPDIARMVLWLAADDSRLVTAQNFVVDAGWT